MGIRQDLGYALRTLRRAPGFVALAVTSLALGIAANIVAFTLFRALLVKNLPIRSPEQLYTSPANISYPQFLLYRDHLDAAALTPPARFSAVTPDGATESTQGQLVSGEYLSVLGVRPVAGRLFSREDVDSGI